MHRVAPSNAVDSSLATCHVAMPCGPQRLHNMPRESQPSPLAVPMFHVQLAVLFGVPWLDIDVLYHILQLLLHDPP